MFAINDNCLFLFLSLLLCLRVCSLGARSIIGSHRVCNNVTRFLIDFISLHLEVECGIHDLVEHQSYNLNNIAVLKQ